MNQTKFKWRLWDELFKTLPEFFSRFSIFFLCFCFFFVFFNYLSKCSNKIPQLLTKLIRSILRHPFRIQFKKKWISKPTETYHLEVYQLRSQTLFREESGSRWRHKMLEIQRTVNISIIARINNFIWFNKPIEWSILGFRTKYLSLQLT